MGHLPDRDVRAERAGAGTHDPLHRLVATLLELRFPQEPKDDPFLVHDNAGIPSGRPDPLADLSDRLVEPARRRVLARHLSGPRALGVRALDRKSGREPVELPVDVVVDVGEPQALEPPRGSWADVSGGVPAVHDDRPAGVELANGI